MSSNVTLNVGLRWDPLFRLTADQARLRISIARVLTPGSRVRSSPTPRQGSSSRVTRGCPGSRSPGAISGTSRRASAAVWDPKGEGRETLRVAYGRLYDMPHLQTYTGLAQMSPWGNAITLNHFPRGWDDPWAATPGRRSDSNAPPGAERELSVFPLAGNYTPYPLDLQASAVDQWNVSYQRQVAADWMVSANYIGSLTKHVWVTDQINPAVYGPGASTCQHAGTPRAESAEPRGRQVLTAASSRSLTTARRTTTGCCCPCSGAAATACRYRRTTPSRGASPTAGTASRASPACRS